mgnify:CR=1 FL=1
MLLILGWLSSKPFLFSFSRLYRAWLHDLSNLRGTIQYNKTSNNCKPGQHETVKYCASSGKWNTQMLRLKLNFTSEDSSSIPLTSEYPLAVRSFEEVIFEIIIGCVLCLLGVTGNGFVCYVIHRSRYTKSSMYFFMTQLAVACCSLSHRSQYLWLWSLRIWDRFFCFKAIFPAKWSVFCSTFFHLHQ